MGLSLPTLNNSVGKKGSDRHDSGDSVTPKHQPLLSWTLTIHSHTVDRQNPAQFGTDETL